MQFSLHETAKSLARGCFWICHQCYCWQDWQPKSEWRILVDKCTNLEISHFFHRKDQMAKASCKPLKTWKDKGIVTKFIWLDVGGEISFSSRGQRERIGSCEFRSSIPRGIHHRTFILHLAFAAIGTKVEQCLFMPMCL